MSDARNDFLARAAAGGMVPFVREVLLDADTPVAAYAKIAAGPFGFLLESLVGGERWARYTFLGTEPREVWRYRGRSVERWTPKEGLDVRRGRSTRRSSISPACFAMSPRSKPPACPGSRAARWDTWATI